MNMVEKVVNDKYYRKFNTENVNWRKLYYLYTIAFLFFFLLTYSKWSKELLKQISLRIHASQLSQYRRAVGVFNSRFLHIKQHKIFKNSFSQGKSKQTIAKKNILWYLSFLIFLSISSSLPFIKFLQIEAKSVCKLLGYVLLTFLHHTWLYLIMFNRRDGIEKILDQSLILVRFFLLVTGI